MKDQEISLGYDDRYLLLAQSHGADLVTITLEEISNGNRFSVEVDNWFLNEAVRKQASGDV